MKTDENPSVQLGLGHIAEVWFNCSCRGLELAAADVSRSDETKDDTMSQLATGLGCSQPKVGSFTCSEGMAK